MIINLITSLCLGFCSFLGLFYLLGFLDQHTSVYKLFGTYSLDIISILSLIIFAISYYFLSKQKSKQDNFQYTENSSNSEHFTGGTNISPAKKSFLISMSIFICSSILFIIFINITSTGGGPWEDFVGVWLLYFLWIPATFLFSLIIGLICYVVFKKRNK